MQYTILVYETEAELAARNDARRKDAYWGAYRAYTKALREAGVMVGGAGLEPPRTATTLRQHDGKRRVQVCPRLPRRGSSRPHVAVSWTARATRRSRPPPRPI